MHKVCIPYEIICGGGFRRKILLPVFFALVVSLALPAWGAADRAVKSRVPPVYPEIAKRMQIRGEVKVEVTVAADGSVKDVKAVSGNHVLQIAAEDAVRKWKFESGPGDAKVVVSVNFAFGQ